MKETILQTRPTALVAMALALLTLLSGCGALVVGGTAATTAIVVTDRRTAGQQVEDKAIEMKVSADMRNLFGETARTNIVSYAGRVLLLGDVPTEQDKQKAQEAASKVENVKEVYNEIRVGSITPLSVRTNDTWLTTKVTTELINTKDVPTRTIVITTERGVVYLMGKVTAAEGERAGKAAASVAGVNKVVKLFEIVSPESVISNQQAPAPIESTASPGNTVSPDMSSDVQTMPVQ